MNRKLAQFVASALTLAFKGEYQSVATCDTIPEDHALATKIGDPVFVALAKMSADCEAYSRHHIQLDNYEMSRHFGFIEICLQNLLSTLTWTLSTKTKWISVHVGRDGSVYKCGTKTQVWRRPDEDILTAWPTKLAEIMSQDFSAPTEKPVVEKMQAGAFKILPSDPRIAEVFKLHEELRNPEIEDEEKSSFAELSSAPLSFLFHVMIHLIFASTGFPEGFEPMNVNFDGTHVTGKMKV